MDWIETVMGELTPRFDVAATTDDAAACALVERERFDLVILDLRLGAGSGLDILRRMRIRVPTLRAIILTGYPEGRSMWRAAKFGALEYVVKGNSAALAALPDTVARILEAASPRVFLSYARQDVAKVLLVYREMAKAGLLPWMDLESIEPDRPWANDIQSALRECDHFVLFLSNLSLVRRIEPGPLQSEEIEARSRANNMPAGFFVVARLEECSIPAELGSRQCIDLFRDGGLDRFMNFLATIRSAEY